MALSTGPEPTVKHYPSTQALEAAALTSWPAAHIERLGGWTLRATSGFTGRANSVHVGADIEPDDLEARLARVLTFYRRHGLLPRVQVPLPHEGLLAGLERRGWRRGHSGVVMAGPLPAGSSASDVRLLDTPEPLLPVWWTVEPRAGSLPDVSAGLLRRIETPVAFALALDPNRPVACATATLRGGLLGIQAIGTLPDARRRGHARRLLHHLFAWGTDRGARHAWLQVAPDNVPAHRLYAGLGLTRRYDYVYLVGST